MSTLTLRLLIAVGFLCSACGSTPTAPTVTGFTLIGIPVGNNVQVEARAQLSDGTTKNVSVNGATWSSSNTNVATVSAIGLVTPGASTGDVEIRATYNGMSATLRLIVEAGKVRLP